MNTKVLNGHVLSDLVSEEQLFIAADLNDISITEVLTPGNMIEVPEVLPTSKVEIRVIPAMIVARTEKVLEGHDLSNLVEEEQIFEAADLNDISITELLTAGVVLTLPDPTKKVAVENFGLVPDRQLTRSLAGQAWIDMCLQEIGSEDSLFEMADLNDVSITDDIAPGTAILSTTAARKEIVRVLQRVKPASRTRPENDSDTGEIQEGVEFWGIEFDFVVS